MLGNILAVGLMSMGMGLSGVKDEPQMYAQNEATYTITYENADDWKTRSDDILSYLVENGNTTSANSLVVTATLTYDNAGTNTTQAIDKMYTNSGYIFLNYNNSTFCSYNTADDTWNKTFVSLSITSQSYYEALAENPPMGEQIIPAIASGLGIIGALASEFLVGFGALFYAEGALTPFAIFALVMLGVTVSFAVVKLVLNIIRSNTGA